MSRNINLPPQLIPYSLKNEEWRKKHLDWADYKATISQELVRKTVSLKTINYLLLNGVLNMRDVNRVLNPDGIKGSFVPLTILHYPIMNSKINVLRGEEAKRPFDFRVTVTNPNAISELEETKKQEYFQLLYLLMSLTSLSEEDFQSKLLKLNKYYNYEWLDLKEIRANALLNHYIKEYNIPLMFNAGFMDAITVSEEIYQCDIISGEPVIEKLDPTKVRVFQSGFSNKIEDADIIVIEDYLSPSLIIDTYYDKLTEEDLKNLNDISLGSDSKSDYPDELSAAFFEEDGIHTLGGLFDSFNTYDSTIPYELAGNIRVLKMYWKSRRRVKLVKSYNPLTGEVIENLYPEDYTINPSLGEEEKIYHINEAWSGIKIGKNIYIDIKPREILYNRLYNPSRCHFGIIGTIYTLNNKTFSLVDMMKPYNYLFDFAHHKLNTILSRDWGKILRLDLSKVPKGWDVDKWLYYAKINGIAVEDSFKEGNYGAATGKLAGSLNSNSSGVIDAEFGDSIQSAINVMEYIKLEMSEVPGITRLREGLISNRETVGGVERATLQSSHITEYLFTTHNDTKKRVLECFLETAKIAFKGRSKKFQYILPDYSTKIIDISGDEFAEADFGLIVDTGENTQVLNQRLDMLAQAALQNNALNFSTIMKLYNSNSLSEKQRMVESNEAELLEMRNQEAEAQREATNNQLLMAYQLKREELNALIENNVRDNEHKLMVAIINNNQKKEIDNSKLELNKEALQEEKNQFKDKIELEREKLKQNRNDSNK